MENILIFIGMAVVGYVGFKLWKSKKSKPADTNPVGSGVRKPVEGGLEQQSKL